MAKDVITVDGKDIVVREDTAKAFRFVHWGVITAAICLTIMAFLFVTFFWMAAGDGKVGNAARPANSVDR